MTRLRLEDLTTARVVVVGDVLVDRWVYGRVERISPEAPVPVFIQERVEECPGGAGNVHANLLALGCTARLVDYFPGKPVKTRYVVGSHHLLRVDAGDTRSPIDMTDENEILRWAQKYVVDIDANVLVLSDYAKGTLTFGVCHRLIKWAKANSMKVVVDPKDNDWTKYAGADVATPNELEFRDIHRGLSAIDDVIMTCGARGMTLFNRDRNYLHLAARNVDPRDVTGCGDTVVAFLAAALSVGFNLPRAAEIANAAAGVVVGKSGTATCSLTELKEMMCQS